MTGLKIDLDANISASFSTEMEGEKRREVENDTIQNVYIEHEIYSLFGTKFGSAFKMSEYVPPGRI